MALPSTVLRPTPPSEVTGAISDAVGVTPAEVRDRLRGLRRLSLVLLAGLLAWVALAPLEEGVPAQASVVVDTKRKAVQHLSGGVVTELLVTEGQVVQAGDVLARMNDSVARAQYQASRERYLTLRAQEARLLAERGGPTARMTMTDELRADADEPLWRQKWQAQEQLLASRRAELAAALASLQESMNGQKASQAASRAMLASRKQQLALLQTQTTDYRALVTQEFAPRNRLLELERQADELNAVIQGLVGNIATAERAIAELHERMAQKRSEYQRDAADQLTVVYRDVEGEAERLRAATDELDRTVILAPVTGQVFGLTVPGPGTVLQPAQKLAEIVPLDERLLLEVRVPPNLANRVRGGQDVDVRFSSFVDAPHLVIRGKVDTASADAAYDPGSQRSFHIARVVVTAEGRRQLGRRELKAGMPAEVIFLTGQRSLLVYWLQPLMRRVASSLTEA